MSSPTDSGSEARLAGVDMSGAAGLLGVVLIAFCNDDRLQKTVAEIIAESKLPGTGANGRPLPLAAHWNVGANPDGFDPEWQLEQIARGHRLLPWFAIPWPKPIRMPKGYYAPLQQCARLQLPIAFVGTQWEKLLSEESEFFDLPPEQNPNVIDKTGRTIRQLSPFGPVRHWKEMGRRWGSSPELTEFQRLYPNPPRVLFVSNNEAQKLKWRNLENCRQFNEMYPGKRDDAFKRKVISNCWVERYSALLEGFREGIQNPAWRDASVFLGYNAFGPRFFGQHDAWMNYSEYTPGRLSPWPAAWDGASPPYYTNNWEPGADYLVFSPQIQCMNWTFMLEEIQHSKPDFWFELAVWDGAAPNAKDDKRAWYAARGHAYSPKRHGAMVQFGMWMLRPRVVREFRASRETKREFGAYFDAIVAAVDRVHDNKTLEMFWRRGELVHNPEGGHPYRFKVPSEYRHAKRWFLLDTDLTPPRPWKDDTEIPVFSLALVIGERPNRRYLLYAHAPRADRQGVEIAIPGYRKVVVDVSQGGVFYLIDEANAVADRVAGG